ncbi:MAG: polysaccharide deacetylase family protein [Burkholderiales bacterium]|nr:polysaccharide deacetylase family protein [Burkholderiales bacterium]
MRRHGRYPYVPIAGRPVYDWPNGARLAFYVAINVEVFPFGEGLGPELNPRQPEPDIPNYTWRDWGNRVGIWRLLDLFDEFDLPLTANLNTAVYDECPQIAAALRERGAEIVGHGRTNAERQADMDEATERAMIAEVTARIGAAEGAPPQGWMGPWVNETGVTPDLLREAGYRYVMDWMMDEQPVWLSTRAGPLIALPYARPTNDITALHGAKVAPSAWADMLVDQFDEMLRQATREPLVFNLSLHPYLVGHAYRLVHLRRAVAHICAQRERIWAARAGEIAAHAAAQGARIPGFAPAR